MLSLWVHGLRRLLSKPTLDWHSFPRCSANPGCSGWGHMGANNGTKRLCPQPRTPGWSLCTWAVPQQDDLPRLRLWEKWGLQSYHFPRDCTQEGPACRPMTREGRSLRAKPRGSQRQGWWDGKAGRVGTQRGREKD